MSEVEYPYGIDINEFVVKSENDFLPGIDEDNPIESIRQIGIDNQRAENELALELYKAQIEADNESIRPQLESCSDALDICNNDREIKHYRVSELETRVSFLEYSIGNLEEGRMNLIYIFSGVTLILLVTICALCFQLRKKRAIQSSKNIRKINNEK